MCAQLPHLSESIISWKVEEEKGKCVHVSVCRIRHIMRLADYKSEKVALMKGLGELNEL